MKNKTIYAAIMVVLLIGVIQQGWVYYQRNHQPVPLPGLGILNQQQQKVTLDEIGSGKNTLVVIFQKDCQFCKREMKAMNDRIGDLLDLQLVFLSMDRLEEIQDFQQQYFPKQTDNVTFGFVTKASIDQLLEEDLLAYPYFLYYDDTGRLKVRHKGLVSVQKILETIDRV